MMNNVLPFSAAPTRMYGAKPLPLLDPNSSQVTGPIVCYRNPSVVSAGVLGGWDADSAHSFLMGGGGGSLGSSGIGIRGNVNTSLAAAADTWDVSWTDEDQYFVDNVVDSCHTPEEVEQMLPSKWVGYKLTSDSEEALSRVCKLCTALVDKFISLSSDALSDQSTGKWRIHQTMLHRLKAVMELLEACIGEGIPVMKLKDPEFVKACWQRLGESDQEDVMSALAGSSGVGSRSNVFTNKAFGDIDIA
eukprot:Tbor_TRINITY_DN4390_c0_g1::TRINITY_DN4390_c0_g1_i1::g.7816::m.7816